MTDSPKPKIPVWSVVGAISLALTLALNSIVGLLLITTRQSQQDYAKCSAEWSQQFAAAYQARLAIATKVDEALDGVVRAVAAQDPAAFRVAVRNYVTLRDDQEAQRQANPLPPLPETLCGDSKEVR